MSSYEVTNGTAIPIRMQNSINPAVINNIVDRTTCFTNRLPVEIVLSIDSSPSMIDNDPSRLRLTAARSFIDMLNSTIDRAAAVSWGGKLGYKSLLMSNFSKLKSDISVFDIESASYLYSQYNTDYNIGIQEPIGILDSGEKNASKIIIFLSDGQHNALNRPPLPDDPNSPIDYARSQRYKIYTIGLNISLGSDAEKLLRAIAEPTGGKYFSSPTARNLESIYNSIFVHEIQHFDFEPGIFEVSVKGGGLTSEKVLPANVVISIDSSSSMKQSDPKNLRLVTSKGIVNMLNPDTDKIGLVSWERRTNFADSLTSNFSSIKKDIDKIKPAGGTNLNVGLSSAIDILNKANITEVATSAIILLSDGRGQYASSKMADSPTDVARKHGYRVFTIGLNMSGEEENDLKDIANATGGLYLSSQSPENLNKIFRAIFQKVLSVKAPENLSLREVFPNYINIDRQSINIPPSSLTKNDLNQSILEWQKISNFSGNKDDKLSSDEEFKVSLPFRFTEDVIKHISKSGAVSNLGNNSILKLMAPIIDNRSSILQYVDTDGTLRQEHSPETYVAIKLKSCNNKEITSLTESLEQTHESLVGYSNVNYPFTIKYPQSWKVEEAGDGISFVSSEDYPYDRYLEGLDVYVIPSNGIPTLGEVVDSLVKQRESDLIGFKLLQSESGTLSGHPSRILYSTYTDSSWGLVKSMATISLVGEKVYILSYLAKPQYFDTKLSIIGQLIDSFKLEQ